MNGDDTGQMYQKLLERIQLIQRLHSIANTLPTGIDAEAQTASRALQPIIDKLTSDIS